MSVRSQMNKNMSTKILKYYETKTTRSSVKTLILRVKKLHNCETLLLLSTSNLFYNHKAIPYQFVFK